MSSVQRTSHGSLAIFTAIRRAFIGAGCSLGRTQEAGYCAYLGLSHFRLKRAANFV